MQGFETRVWKLLKIRAEKCMQRSFKIGSEVIKLQCMCVLFIVKRIRAVWL